MYRCNAMEIDMYYVRNKKWRLVLVFVALAGRAAATGEDESTTWWKQIPEHEPPEIQQLEAEPLWTLPAREAVQGAAVDDEYVYAVANFVLGKYNRETRKRIDTWTGQRGGLIKHLNSCVATGNSKLVCAHSNFPELPMASSIEIFDTESMMHSASHSLGFGLGSLTWVERQEGSWWAGFAHYEGKGGEPDRPSKYASVASYDDKWRLTEQWLLPASVIDRLSPHAASGGSFGPDGLLYLTGHDRREMYVLDFPDRGSYLVHLATISIDIAGQAFSWDRSSRERVVVGINRPDREIRAFRLPIIERLPEEDRRQSGEINIRRQNR